MLQGLQVRLKQYLMLCFLSMWYGVEHAGNMALRTFHQPDYSLFQLPFYRTTR